MLHSFLDPLHHSLAPLLLRAFCHCPSPIILPHCKRNHYIALLHILHDPRHQIALFQKGVGLQVPAIKSVSH
jgi:hypothetical protein